MTDHKSYVEVRDSIELIVSMIEMIYCLQYIYEDHTIDSSQSEREFCNLAALQFPENRGATIIIEF